MNIEYKKVDNNNIDSLKKLLIDNFNIEINSVINSNNQYSLIALMNDEVVGHLLFTRIFNPIRGGYYGKIDYVCVDEKYRNNHIATNLLKEIEKTEKSIAYLELTSNKSRIAANKLYLNSGYNIIDTNLFRKIINN
ncbi:MAG: GNAT family N-acetyltransferase [Bacilli bacterium]|nr:GNAT family N-acetyltransferase [Bacilli bacterium]